MTSGKYIRTKPVWNKGLKNIYSEETLLKMGKSNKGRKLSDEHKNKISISNSGEKNHMFGKKITEKERKRLITIRKGTKHTEETKQKMREASFGKKKSITHALNISKGKKGLVSVKGSKCWNWKGGISKIDKLCRDMREYKEWRSDVFTRDNWTCQTCKITGIYVTAHHKKGFNKIITEHNIKTMDDARLCNELWDRNNGVTLCEECHKLTDNYKGKSINKKTKNN